MNTTSSLEDRIKAMIVHDGPMDVATYMRLCLTDPQDGYYTNANPFGVDGDFITAPEVSQLFGEMIGIWVIDIWQKLGSPKDIVLAEAGPGRGTLMTDVIRVIQKLNPDLFITLEIHLVETSSALIDQQKLALQQFGHTIYWHNAADTLPDQPTIFIANEFLDALPILQFHFQDGAWFERVVGLNEEEHLTFGLQPSDCRLPEPKEVTENPIVEICPHAREVVATLSKRFARTPGAALFIDYGHLKSGYGDTLQAVADHAYLDPLERPGKADITAHVDFEPLVTLAKGAGVQARTTTQGKFLLSLGLLERAGKLGGNLTPKEQETISDAVERLAAPQQMGDLFKVLAITPEGIDPHGF